MFEKEAEEAIMKKYPSSVQGYKNHIIDWKDGAEFGYKKGFEECAKARLNVTTISDCPIKDEWHYVKDGDLPKNENRVWLCFGVDDYNDGQFIRGRFWCGSCGWFDVEEVIAWKEIVLPEEEIEKWK